MNYSKLAEVLRAKAEKIQDQLDHPDRLDTAEIFRVLARICEGKEIPKAFGAPGDWGYGTPIGDALKEAYCGRPATKPS